MASNFDISVFGIFDLSDVFANLTKAICRVMTKQTNILASHLKLVLVSCSFSFYTLLCFDHLLLSNDLGTDKRNEY